MRRCRSHWSGADVAVIDIVDLLHPVLTPLQKEAMAEAAAHPVVLEEAVILEAARQATGLSDFGSDDFRPRLRLWLSETNADADLSALGRATIYHLVFTYAVNRLRIEDTIKRHPEILDIKIDRPIIVAGLPRSGTTYLQGLLSADTRLRSLPMWEAMCPVPGPDDEPRPGDDNPRRTRAQEAWSRFDAIVPYTKNIHEMSPDHVSEDIELQCLDFGSYYIEWRINAPRWRDYYLQTDHTPIYSYMKKALQVLTWFKGPNRWALKCPQHMEQLIPLAAVFPDATVVLTHRDPVASIQSALVGVCYVSRITRNRIAGEEVAAYWVDRYERLLEACVRDRAGLSDARAIDVYFDKLMADPMTVVAEIYAKAGLQLTKEAQKQMSEFNQENQRGKHGKILYNLRRDFGLRASEIRKKFRRYSERFPVRIEVVDEDDPIGADSR
jgi:hypothetical protein